MKKKIIIGFIILIIIIVSCILGIYKYLDYRDSSISLTNENIVIEYGENYKPNISELIDLEKYNFVDESKVTIKNEISNEEGKDYPAVGSYNIFVSYKNKELVQKVEVKDSIKPEITINESIEVPYNTDLENYDFKDYIKINDLSKTNDYTIDFSNVNKEVAGEYVATIKLSDIYNNETQKEFKIIVQEKIEETKDEIPSNNVEKTSNQTKAQNKSNTQSTNKTSSNNNSKVNASSKKETTGGATNNNQEKPKQQENTAYWCVDGGSHHLAGDGANEHGYYKSWDSAFQAFKEYTKDWDSCQYKVDVCACGLYYFWATK